MTSIYFTLCSNNYLPFAFTLGKSIGEFEAEAKFVIGLVDQLDPHIDYSTWKEFEFLPCFDLGYPEFEAMLARYNIIEFNTAVKPFYFEYLFAKYPEVDQIYYLDPDLYFYQSPKVMDKEWGEAEILLTPNLIYTTPKPSTGELASLRHGMYNLGFIGLKRGAESFRLIQWWKERLKEHCRIDKCFGIFVDQKWMDLAPLFFEKIKSIKNPGWNMAWWNFSERKLLVSSYGYAVNDSIHPLLFFHFSGFKPGLTKLTERISFQDINTASEQILVRLFKGYEDLLLENGYHDFKPKNPILRFKQEPDTLKNSLRSRVNSKIRKFIKSIFPV